MPRSGRSARLAGVIGALGLALVACTAPASSGPGTSAPSLPPGTFAVEAKEYAFTPSTLTVPAGSVTFSVKNAGTQEHEFEIFEGETVVDEIEGLVPGLTKTLTVTLDAGTYTFMCKLNGHDQLGMKGSLTVS